MIIIKNGNIKKSVNSYDIILKSKQTKGIYLSSQRMHIWNHSLNKLKNHVIVDCLFPKIYIIQYIDYQRNACLFIHMVLILHFLCFSPVVSHFSFSQLSHRVGLFLLFFPLSTNIHVYSTQNSNCQIRVHIIYTSADYTEYVTQTVCQCLQQAFRYCLQLKQSVLATSNLRSR